MRSIEELCIKIEKQNNIISILEKKVQILEEKIYGNSESLKTSTKIISQIEIFMRILKNLRTRRMRVHGHLRNMI